MGAKRKVLIVPCPRREGSTTPAFLKSAMACALRILARALASRSGFIHRFFTGSKNGLSIGTFRLTLVGLATAPAVACTIGGVFATELLHLRKEVSAQKAPSLNILMPSSRR